MKQTVSLTRKAKVVVGVAGRLERLDAEATRLERPLHDLEAVTLDELVVAGDVIGVGVGREQVRDREAVALDRLVQAVERAAAVDEHGRTARLVRDEIRVREPLRVHAPLDQHLGSLRLHAVSPPATSCGAASR